MTTLKEDLKKQIAERQCIVIVGAGVSIHSTNNAACASWTGLLHHGVQHCFDVTPDLPANWADRTKGDIDSGDLDDLLAGAEKISRKLNAPLGGEYRRWLRESVGTLKAENSELLIALKELGAIIATTNYDNLLEDATGLPARSWRDSAQVERVLRGDEQAILHLHGHYQSPESVILGIRSYEQVLGNEHAQAMQRAMTSLKTLLFVGCGDGLHDPNFAALLAWTAKLFASSEYRRFRLARSNEISDLQKQHPPEQRLFVLDYGANFNDLAPYLRSLASPTALPAALPTPAPTPARLPSRPRCIGRDAECSAIISALFASPLEPLPILGPPGIGKTTLALTAAHDDRIAARYGTRRYFIRCDGLKSRSDLAAALATALELKLGNHNEGAALIALESAPSLLILDNAETPWEADTLGVEELFGLLADIPGLALIVTIRSSQRPQGVRWREPFRLAPLNPDIARELFLSLAGRHFATDAKLDLLLTAVDHVPLAITLLAPLAESEPDLANLWQRWQEERTSMLIRADGKDRLTNIELSYELSWSGPRMNDAARQLLQRLAHLPAGLAHADLKAILPSGPQAATTLRQTALAYDEDARLRVLAPLREYVLKKHPLDEAGLEKLARHFVDLTCRLGAKIGESGGDITCARLASEAPNIEPLLMHALSCQSPVGAITAASNWGKFIDFTGVGRIEPLERAATVAHQIGYKLGEANCHLRYAHIAYIRSESKIAREKCQTALYLFQKASNPIGEAECVYFLGKIAEAQSCHDNAITHYQAALSLCRKEKSIIGEASCIKSLGDIASARAEFKLAKTAYEKAMKLFQKTNTSLDIANCYLSLGELALCRAEYGQVRQHCQAALRLYKKIGNLLGEANCIRNLGDAALRCSDLVASQRQYGAALRIYQKLKEPVGEANCIVGLGNIALRRDELDSARQEYEAALPLFQKSEEIFGQGDCHFGIARIHQIQGNMSAATSAIRAALSSYERSGHPYAIGSAHALWSQLTSGDEQTQHRQTARNTWRVLEPQALAAWAALDGLDPQEIMADQDCGTS